MIEVLNRETVIPSKKKAPFVQICNGGHLRFNCAAVELLGLEEGDKLEFYLSSDDRDIIYFNKSEKGFPLRNDGTFGERKRLAVLCRPLSRKFTKHFGITKNTSYDLTNAIADFYGKKCFFILKEKKHIPIKWKPKIKS